MARLPHYGKSVVGLGQERSEECPAMVLELSGSREKVVMCHSSFTHAVVRELEYTF